MKKTIPEINTLSPIRESSTGEASVFDPKDELDILEINSPE